MSQSIGTRGQLASLSAPAVVFTVLLIAFPFGYTIWMSLHEFSFGGTSTMTYGQNYLLMLDDAEFWNGLRITVVLYLLSFVPRMQESDVVVLAFRGAAGVLLVWSALLYLRLKREGAILVGKTTTSEFGAKCLTDAPLFGRTRNAWSAQSA